MDEAHADVGKRSAANAAIITRLQASRSERRGPLKTAVEAKVCDTAGKPFDCKQLRICIPPFFPAPLRCNTPEIAQLTQLAASLTEF
jgi:hypothetical protein